jgi:recombination protein RecR
MIYTQPLARLIEEFQKLPGIGVKTAQRLAFKVLDWSEPDVEDFARAMIEAKQTIRRCEICFNLSMNSPCEICCDTTRDKAVICVVSEPRDLFALEKTGEYRGLYHILDGLISPMDGVGTSELHIAELIHRLSDPDHPVGEIILALPPSVEGDTTSLYLTRMIKPLGIRLTRIAFGLPVGGELEYADTMTLSRALAGRNIV